MRACLDRLLAQPMLTGPIVHAEYEFVAARLEQCRHDGTISNDAFLAAGAIQGALEMIANHIDMGIPQKEIQLLVRQQIERAQRLDEKYPGLDNAVQSER